MHQGRLFLKKKKAQFFLIILRIYNCSNLPFNVDIFFYYCNLFFNHIFNLLFLFFSCNVVYRTCIDSSFFLKLMQQSCINMFKLLLLLFLLLLLLITMQTIKILFTIN